MPFSRFEKLAPAKRKLLLDVAAREFASYGYEQASLNRILEQAQMSKGAAYYYFEDKGDLFYTVIQYVGERLGLADLQVDLAALTAKSFWPVVAELRRTPLLRAFEQPWLFRVLGVAAQAGPALHQREPLAMLVQRIKALVLEFIRRGQELEVIRTDLPDELIFAWLMALDQASDDWLMSRWEGMDRAAIARLSDQTIAAISSALAAPGQ
jgi:AcrR family transcriptional regulator